MLLSQFERSDSLVSVTPCLVYLADIVRSSREPVSSKCGFDSCFRHSRLTSVSVVDAKHAIRYYKTIHCRTNPRGHNRLSIYGLRMISLTVRTRQSADRFADRGHDRRRTQSHRILRLSNERMTTFPRLFPNEIKQVSTFPLLCSSAARK